MPHSGLNPLIFLPLSRRLKDVVVRHCRTQWRNFSGALKFIVVIGGLSLTLSKRKLHSIPTLF
uniref:Uncharacterized protein n=1 Tax=Cannabis sativa TaxID=3483 RepID=A0A803R3G1_CANSA